MGNFYSRDFQLPIVEDTVTSWYKYYSDGVTHALTWAHRQHPLKSLPYRTADPASLVLELLVKGEFGNSIT